jgi:tartrate-resistant acid phosphatase type 5
MRQRYRVGPLNTPTETHLWLIGYAADTSGYIGQVCAIKNCSAFVGLQKGNSSIRSRLTFSQISVGDNFYDSGVDFTTGGILRFQEAWVDMYSQGVFQNVPWYQCLGNHDIVKGQSGVDFQTKIAPIYDDRWYFVSSGKGPGEEE